MKLKILGSGGIVSMPRPLCFCKKCEKARKIGIPYTRTGSSLFIEDEKILIDTPEDIRQQIERERIKNIKNVFYTHWHPDHTWGIRIFEQISATLSKRKKLIHVFIPEDVYDDFKKYLPTIFYYEDRGFIKITKVQDRKSLKIGKIFVTPLNFKRRDRVRYGYLIQKGKKRVIFAPCSTFEIFIDNYYKDIDLLILELGWLDGNKELRKKLPKSHVFQQEACFEENIELISNIKPKRTVFVHIEATRHLDFDFIKKKIDKFRDRNIKLGYDGIKIKI